jgi:hypothetical protein
MKKFLLIITMMVLSACNLTNQSGLAFRLLSLNLQRLLQIHLLHSQVRHRYPPPRRYPQSEFTRERHISSMEISTAPAKNFVSPRKAPRMMRHALPRYGAQLALNTKTEISPARWISCDSWWGFTPARFKHHGLISCWVKRTTPWTDMAKLQIHTEVTFRCGQGLSIHSRRKNWGIH